MIQDSIDVGIVVRDAERSLVFYRDLLGLDHVADTALPDVGASGVVHRLSCGGSLLKLVELDATPESANPPGGLPAATGIRYITLAVVGLDEMLQELEAAGCIVALSAREARPGVRIGMVNDPDGNCVELLELLQTT